LVLRFGNERIGFSFKPLFIWILSPSNACPHSLLQCYPGADPDFVGPEAYTIFGSLYKIGYEIEYLFRAPPRALEGAHESERPCSLSFVSFTVFPPLLLTHH